MIRQRISAAWRFVLLTAFMAAQGTPAHAHLTAQHDHGGERHRHSAEAHVHQAAVVHADAIDTGHVQIDEAQVVDLGHAASTSGACQWDSPPLALLVETRRPPAVNAIALVLPADGNALPDLLPPHIGQPRAPPPLA